MKLPNILQKLHSKKNNEYSPEPVYYLVPSQALSPSPASPARTLLGLC